MATTSTGDARAADAPKASSSPVRIVPITAAAIPALAQIGTSAFNAGAAAVGQPVEFPNTDVYAQLLEDAVGRKDVFHAMAVRGVGEEAKAGEGYVEGVGEVLGSVLMDCSGEAAGLGPISVASTAQKAGVGRQLMTACLEDADRRQMLSVRLVQIVANARAFTLYHSLGFRAAEYAMQFKGSIPAAQGPALVEEMQREAITVRAMREEDIPHCERLHLATTSFSRLASIQHAFHSQPAERAAKAAREGQHSNGASKPARLAFVAVDQAGAVVGYCDGPSTTNHWVAVRASVLLFLYYRVGVELGEQADAWMTLYVLTRQQGELLERLMQLKVRVLRQLCLMVKGAYVQPHRFVYCPSVLW